MKMYEKLVETLKTTFGLDPQETLVPGVQTSSIMSAELLLMASVLIALSTIRLISLPLMIVLEVAFMIGYIYVAPIMPKLYKENNDSLNNMMFYAIIALAIIALIFNVGGSML